MLTRSIISFVIGRCPSARSASCPLEHPRCDAAQLSVTQIQSSINQAKGWELAEIWVLLSKLMSFWRNDRCPLKVCGSRKISVHYQSAVNIAYYLCRYVRILYVITNEDFQTDHRLHSLISTTQVHLKRTYKACIYASIFNKSLCWPKTKNFIKVGEGIDIYRAKKLTVILEDGWWKASSIALESRNLSQFAMPNFTVIS